MNKTVKYKSNNGYTGYMGGMSTLVVVDDNGNEVFHTGRSKVNTFRQLMDFVDSFPERKDA